METNNGPFFVKIDEFKNIVDTLKQMKSKVDEANKLLDQLSELKTKEEAAIDEWKQQLDDVSRRVEAVEGNLFEQ
ncbi:MAG: hypothetical protein ABIC95_04815 [archaeon]